MTEDHPSQTCPECLYYLSGRESVLPKAIADSADAAGISATKLFRSYMGGVHERHLAGLSLAVSA